MLGITTGFRVQNADCRVEDGKYNLRVTRSPYNYTYIVQGTEKRVQGKGVGFKVYSLKDATFTISGSMVLGKRVQGKENQ